MSLTTKRKPPAHARKRQAQHHKRGKSYTKPYLPYLPMAAIVAGGGIVNAVWNAGSSVASADTVNASVESTRLASMTGGKSDSLVYVVMAVTFIAFVLFMATHWYRFHRMLNRGEAFVVTHPLFDVTLVFVITAGVVLTRIN
jgi:hypothetical protein